MKMIVKEKNEYIPEKFGKVACEYHYSTIIPGIIYESLLGDSNCRMIDYKKVSANGKVKYILVCSERDEGW